MYNFFNNVPAPYLVHNNGSYSLLLDRTGTSFCLSNQDNNIRVNILLELYDIYIKCGGKESFTTFCSAYSNYVSDLSCIEPYQEQYYTDYPYEYVQVDMNDSELLVDDEGPYEDDFYSFGNRKNLACVQYLYRDGVLTPCWRLNVTLAARYYGISRRGMLKSINKDFSLTISKNEYDLLDLKEPFIAGVTEVKTVTNKPLRNGWETHNNLLLTAKSLFGEV